MGIMKKYLQNIIDDKKYCVYLNYFFPADPNGTGILCINDIYSHAYSHNDAHAFRSFKLFSKN